MTTTPAPVAGLTTRPATGTTWKLDGLCAQTDPDIFFPEKGAPTREAKAVCMACEVRAQCLDYAMQNNERFGIWGGLSESKRRKLRQAQPTPEPQPEPVRPAAVLPRTGRPAQGGGTPPAKCGTETAHRRHKRNREPIDEACAAAHLAYLDETREARRGRRQRSKARIRARQGSPRPLSPCGTPAAYSRHRRRGEEVCDECRKASTEARRKYGRTTKTAPSTPATDTARAWNSFEHSRPYGWQKPQLTIAQWTEIQQRLAAGETPQVLALEYRVTASSIRGRALAS